MTKCENNWVLFVDVMVSVNATPFSVGTDGFYDGVMMGFERNSKNVGSV